jgi:hypothetical protein
LTPPHVFTHEAARLITPWPHDVEHWLNEPSWHWYEGQHGSAGHGDVELWQLPGQNATATWAPSWPFVVSKQPQLTEREPAAPQVTELHWPTCWHWHSYVLQIGSVQAAMRSPGHENR